MQRGLFWILLAIGLIAGLAITWVDTRPTWDDTGITAGAILLTTGLLGLSLPQRAWAFALAVGGWIPIIGIARSGNYAALLALVVAIVGAYAGALGRVALSAMLRASAGQPPRK